MATRRITGTLDTFSVDSGSEITYVGGATTGDKSDDVGNADGFALRSAGLVRTARKLAAGNLFVG